jgi:hypothetical protein
MTKKAKKYKFATDVSEISGQEGGRPTPKAKATPFHKGDRVKVTENYPGQEANMAKIGKTLIGTVLEASEDGESFAVGFDHGERLFCDRDELTLVESWKDAFNNRAKTQVSLKRLGYKKVKATVYMSDEESIESNIIIEFHDIHGVIAFKSDPWDEGRYYPILGSAENLQELLKDNAEFGYL